MGPQERRANSLRNNAYYLVFYQKNTLKNEYDKLITAKLNHYAKKSTCFFHTQMLYTVNDCEYLQGVHKYIHNFTVGTISTLFIKSHILQKKKYNFVMFSV